MAPALRRGFTWESAFCNLGSASVQAHFMEDFYVENPKNRR